MISLAHMNMSFVIKDPHTNLSHLPHCDTYLIQVQTPMCAKVKSHEFITCLWI